MVEQSEQRRLAAILAADVVGYSRLMRADEAGTLAAIKGLWREVVQPSVRAHRGRVFKLMGDGMLAEFGSVVDAANAAEAIQATANALAEAQVEGRPIQLRIGINLGDIVVDGSDLYGDGVNIAARLQEVAPVGGIAVSTGTYESLRGKTGIDFADAGERTLKNIEDPVRVWHWPDTGEPAQKPTAGPARSSQPSIAVLPFQNLSSAPDAAFFADGMTEDVINALSKFSLLFVIARGTMFTYKDKSVGTAQVAAELGVRYVLEGSVRQAGERIRVSVQLVDTETGNPLWTERFDRLLDDIFTIQDEITVSITSRIARMILANVYRGDELESLSRDAKDKAEQAYAIDPSEPLAMLATARIHSGLGNHDAAVEHARKAVSANPYNVLALDRLSQATIMAGLFDECIEHCEEALSRSPFDPRETMIKSVKAMCHYCKGDYERSLSTILSAKQPKQISINFRCVEAMSLAKLGRQEEAQSAVAKVLADFPRLSIAFMKRGNRNYAKTLTDPWFAGLRDLGVPEA
jgi:adenylate cyclase